MIYWEINFKYLRQHLFSTHKKFSEKLTCLTLWYTENTCAYQGVRNVSFIEDFTCSLNRWQLRWKNWINCYISESVNSYLVNISILYSLKTQQNQKFFWFFRGYKMESFTKNVLKRFWQLKILMIT